MIHKAVSFPRQKPFLLRIMDTMGTIKYIFPCHPYFEDIKPLGTKGAFAYMAKKGQTWSWSDRARKQWSRKRKGQVPKIPHEARFRKYICDDQRIKNCFHWMHCRCNRMKRKCGFPRTQEGFAAFLKEMGPIPDCMLRPSVGRKDHDLGYIAGNIEWEEFKHNVWKKRKIEDQRAKAQMAEEPENEIPF
jgi:hypothetical protein